MVTASRGTKIEPSKEKPNCWDVLEKLSYSTGAYDDNWKVLQSGVASEEEAKAMADWYAGSLYYIDVKYNDWKNMPENVRPSKPWGNF